MLRRRRILTRQCDDRTFCSLDFNETRGQKGFVDKSLISRYPYSPFINLGHFSNQSLSGQWQFSVSFKSGDEFPVRRALGGWGVLNKVLYGEAPPRGPNPYPFIYHFYKKRYPFRIPFVENGTPFIYLGSDFCSTFHFRNPLKY